MDHPDHQGFWFAWAWRCWFSKRTEVELHEQAWLGERPEVRTVHDILFAVTRPHILDPATSSSMPTRENPEHVKTEKSYAAIPINS